MNKRTDRLTKERTNEWTMNEWTNKWMNERMRKKWMIEKEMNEWLDQLKGMTDKQIRGRKR